MTSALPDGVPEHPAQVLAGDGEAARLMRATDWAGTAVGPVQQWPAALRTIVRMMLQSRHPMFLWWGPELIQFYNDAYIPSFGVGKHPAAMGQRGVDCWQEIWPIIWPQIDDVMTRGKASWHEDHLVPIFRNGRIEEVYWTYGYSPITGDDGVVAGTLVVCTETTSRVVALRRQHLLRTFATALSGAQPLQDFGAIAADFFRHEPVDVPVFLRYRWSAAESVPQWADPAPQDRARLSATDTAVRQAVAASAHARKEIAEGRPVLLRRVVEIPTRHGPEPVTDVFLVPAAKPIGEGLGELIACGLNPRVPFNDAYHELLVQVTSLLSFSRTRFEAARMHAAFQDERNNLLEQAPVAAAVMVGPNLTYQLANPLYRRIVGRDDVVGKTFEEAFPELVGTPFPDLLRRVYRSGVGYSSPETVVRLDRQGTGELEDCHFEFNLEPVRNLAGEVYGLMAVAVDVSAQVAARRMLERSHAERQSLLERAEAAARAKDEFLAMLGHELRNPLSPIFSTLDVMRLRAGGSESRELATIRRQVAHMARLVDDLLDVARIVSGKVELRDEVVRIGDVLGDAADMVRPLLEERGHAFRLVLDDENLTCRGDQVRLAQCVSNLLGNAARYTPAGGHVDLRAHREGAEVVIEVADDGPGIDADTLPHLFEIFVRSNRGRTMGGLGIGLAVVRNLVALHGGSVECRRPRSGKGSEFRIRLPHAGSVAGTAAVPSAPAADSPVAGKRLLLVDDNEDAAQSLAELLRLYGHTVQVANDPMCALAIAAESRFEVAVLDIGLPVMDGYELAARLRDQTDGSLVFIALSGYGRAADHERSAAAGFVAHLVKPVDIGKLERLLHEVG